jgi:hypothetical protein
MDYLAFITEKIKPFREYGQWEIDNSCTAICQNFYPETNSFSWCHWLYQHVGKDEIAKLEVKIKRNIHEGYKCFLIQMNGIGLFHSSINLYGNTIDYKTGKRILFSPFGIDNANEYTFNYGERPVHLLDDLLVIGSYNDGSRIGILGSNGKVVRYDVDSLEGYNVWDSFEKFFITEFERISEMFNTNGTKKDSKIPTTPVKSTNSENNTINLVRTDDYTFYKKPVRVKSKRDEW